MKWIIVLCSMGKTPEQIKEIVNEESAKIVKEKNWNWSRDSVVVRVYPNKKGNTKIEKENIECEEEKII